MSIPAFWLVKQEPTAYSWQQFCQDKQTAWTGVRNFQARRNLAAMQIKDMVLFYHSVIGKCVMGVAEVLRASYLDPTAEDGKWVCVDLAPLTSLAHPVSLEAIKHNPVLADIALLRQSRLSVMPLTKLEFEEILRMGA